MFVCDYKIDCKFSEDEEHCHSKENEKFFCHNSNKYINYKHVCNFINDCDDGSDELFCSKNFI